MTIQSLPDKETFEMVIDGEEITILRCGQTFLRFSPSPELWARLATVGLVVNGREGREAVRRMLQST